MKNVRNILLFLALIHGQFSYTSVNYFKPNKYKRPKYEHSLETIYEISADDLTNESYMTPEMLASVAFALKPDQKIYINIQTGQVANIPNINDLLEELPNNESARNSFHTMLEATEIALKVVEIQSAYDQTFTDSDDLIVALNQQKQEIQNRLAMINSKRSYYAWIFGTDGAHKYTPGLAKAVEHTQQNIIISEDLMPFIIKSNDYKQKLDTTLAANILFQQCFIAQQHRFSNPIPLTWKQPLTTSNFIYSNFPKIYDKNSGKYPICDDILKLDKEYRRQRLLQIRQAIQTALFIANKKSSYNTGYDFTQGAISYLDRIVAELMRYDNYVNTLCTDLRYGALPSDAAKAAEWSTMSKVLGGIIVVGGALAAVHLYDKKALPSSYNAASGAVGSGYNQITQQASDIANWWNKPSAVVTPQVAESATDTSNAATVGKALQKIEDAPAMNNNSKQAALAQAEKDYAAIKAKNKYNSHPEVIKAQEKVDALKDQLSNSSSNAETNQPLLQKQAQQSAPAAQLKQDTTKLINKLDANVPQQSFWEKALTRANKSLDNNAMHAEASGYSQERSNDAIDYQNRVNQQKSFVKGSISNAAVGLGLTYEAAVKTAEENKIKADSTKAIAVKEENQAKSLTAAQQKLVNQDERKLLELTRQQTQANLELEKAKLKNPGTWSLFQSQTPDIISAQTKIDAIEAEKNKLKNLMSEQKEKLSDLQQSQSLKATEVQTAKNNSAQAQENAYDARQNLLVANTIKKEEAELIAKKTKENLEKIAGKEALLEPSLTDKFIDAKNAVTNKVMSIKDDIQNYSLPTVESALAKEPYSRTGLDKIALIRDGVSNTYNSTAQRHAQIQADQYKNSLVGKAQQKATEAYDWLTTPAQPSVSTASTIPLDTDAYHVYMP